MTCSLRPIVRILTGIVKYDFQGCNFFISAIVPPNVGGSYSYVGTGYTNPHTVSLASSVIRVDVADHVNPKPLSNQDLGSFGHIQRGAIDTEGVAKILSFALKGAQVG